MPAAESFIMGTLKRIKALREGLWMRPLPLLLLLFLRPPPPAPPQLLLPPLLPLLLVVVVYAAAAAFAIAGLLVGDILLIQIGLAPRNLAPLSLKKSMPPFPSNLPFFLPSVEGLKEFGVG